MSATGTVVGNLTSDVEVKQLSDNGGVMEYSVAVNHRPYKNKDGELVEKVSFFNCKQYYRGGCEPGVAKYLKKGQKVACVFSLEQERWESAEGKRSKVILSVRELELCGGKSGDGGKDKNVSDDVPF